MYLLSPLNNISIILSCKPNFRGDMSYKRRMSKVTSDSLDSCNIYLEDCSNLQYSSDDDFDSDDSIKLNSNGITNLNHDHGNKYDLIADLITNFHIVITRLKFYWFKYIPTAITDKPKRVLIVLIIMCFAFSYTLIFQNNSQIDYLEDFMEPPLSSTPLHKIILPEFNKIYVNSNSNVSLTSIDSIPLFDPRLMPALLLLYLRYHLLNSKGPLDNSFTVPFSWSDWIDIPSKLDYNLDYLTDWLSIHSPDFLDHLEDFTSLNCDSFCILYNCEGNKNFKDSCVDIDKADNSTGYYNYNFKIIKEVDTKIKEEGRVLISASYLYHSMPPPNKIYLMGLLGDKGEGNLVLSVEKNKKTNEKLIRNRNGIFRNTNVLKEIINFESKINNKRVEEIYSKSWELENLRKTISSLLKKKNIKSIITDNVENLKTDETCLIMIESARQGLKESFWNEEDFLWDEDTIVAKLSEKYLRSNLRNSMDDADNLDRLLLDHVLIEENFKIENGYHPKYLHEAQIYDSTIGSHYDWRFFQSTLILNDHRQSIIHRLARTWLRFCFQNNLKTFIAYGSMLGWIRNGLTLPWDGDIDVIVTMDTLYKLARNFNQTLVVDYTSKDGFQSGLTSYLIDISPSFYSRTKEEGFNAIDARLIDISTGIYLDITALAWTEGYLSQTKLSPKIKKIADRDYEVNKIFEPDLDIYENTLLQKLKQLETDKKIVHCKNDNFFLVDELSPMIPSFFEGSRALFPHKYEQILRRLYPDALDRITEPGHVYKEYLRLWVPEKACDWHDKKGKLCENPEVLQEYRLTKDYTERHLKMLNNPESVDILSIDSESKPLRIDDFFEDYAHFLDISDDELEQYYH